jgi:uncharacterized protein with HEPN domain
MRPEDRDAAHMHDAIEAGNGIARYLGGCTYERYVADELTRLAVERQLTIIGEAVRRLSASFCNAHPEIPWSKIVGLRNVLMHEYDEIDHHRIFVIATDLVPQLVTQLQSLLPPVPPDPEPESS